MPSSPFAINNIRLFIAFRIFFNARFYYPVFTILFLDYGLTIEQFALLNSVWAFTIVCAEVPSGALADLFGRKHLIVSTSLLMMAEISLLAFVPLGNGQIIFWAFLFNRILSGLAEAMASGADEALAYDSLVAQGDPADWPKVLSLLMRLQSVASIFCMTVGALIYDPSLLNHLLGWLGFSQTVDQQITMRFPIYLTLILAVLAIMSALRMSEQKTENQAIHVVNTLAALKMTWNAGKWITQTPFALAIILFGMCYDHILRMIVTMTSQYFRLIDLPEASFGLIGSAFALLGLFVPKIAERMAFRNSPTTNMLWLSAITLVALFGISGFFPYWGLLPMGLVFIAMMFVSFFTSHYLNRITASYQRATVLSFKGMAFNLAYGLIGFSFALLLASQRGIVIAEHGDLSLSAIEDLTFQNAIGWFPWYTIVILTVTIIYCLYRLKGLHAHKTKESHARKY
ncbi:MFS transporter [Psychromonas antarctica]|uniref:MFS transporter n=1 Tax=Psychromonas antarctica TaxID=67573 RepID=UPI001EE7A088|nr:MFS transporter [Psychromonas antarctica]MCG6200644.1 MFS transporter [Psychromonas antarctica]